MTSSHISELIAGWFDTIITAPEIKDVLTPKLRKEIKGKKEQISNCAAKLFLDNYKGYDLLRRQATQEIEQSIINSVKECLKTIQNDR